MAYETGTLNNLAEIQTVILTFLTDNGWTWDAGASTIYKDSMFVRFIAPTADLKVLFKGTTALTGGVNAPLAVGLGRLNYDGYVPAILTFPATYWAFLNDDEFYFVVRYDVAKYQYVMWGKSTVTNLGAGATGTYISGSCPELAPSAYYQPISSSIYIDAYGSVVGYPTLHGMVTPAPFWESCIGDGMFSGGNTPNRSVSFVNVDNTLSGWTVSNGLSAVGNGYAGNLQSVTPNAWNSEAPLLPLRCYKRMDESKVMLVVDLHHARQCRVDNFNDAEIISIGSDDWQIFPFHRKDIANRNGGVNIDHTGTFGWAIRKVI